MTYFYHNIWHILLMLLLLCCSAFFSGAETAYFNLSRRQIGLLRKSKHKLSNLAAALIITPKQLLSSLLFGNMTVNVLFFALSSILVFRTQQLVGVTAATFTAAVSFLLLILFGEILPKSVSYTNSRNISIIAALPTYTCVKLFTPIISVFNFVVVEPALRLLLGPTRKAKTITKEEFRSLINQIRKRGLITHDENRLLSEIIDIEILKVRDCLKPRVDMITCGVKAPPQTAIEMMQKHNLTKVPLYSGKIDNIIGMVYLRQLLLNPDTTLDKLVQKINFVPEQKTVESLLEFFRKTQTDTAIVVDEYGGIAGSVCVEDIAEEILGPIEIQSNVVEPIEQIGPLEYRLAGNMAIHDWATSFGIETSGIRFSTIGGLVTALLGKVPKAGDVTRLGNLKFTVEKVQRRRVESVILTLESLKKDDK